MGAADTVRAVNLDADLESGEVKEYFQLSNASTAVQDADAEITNVSSRKGQTSVQEIERKKKRSWRRLRFGRKSDRISATDNDNVIEYLKQKKVYEKTDGTGQSLPGYPSLAEFLGSDTRWLMCRRFGALQARLILEKQDEIRNIEENIYAFDQDEFNKPMDEDDQHDFQPRMSTRRRIDEDEAHERQKLFREAEIKFKEYANLVTAAQKMATFGPPASDEYSTVKDFILETKPLRPSEIAWVFEKNDLIALHDSNDRAFPSVSARIEKAINRLKAWRSYHNATLQDWLDENAQSVRQSNFIVAYIFLLLVGAMFVVPMYALMRVENNIGQSLGILLAFTFAFAIVLTSSAKLKPHQVLSGSAGYLAVLVVFFGSAGPRQSQE